MGGSTSELGVSWWGLFASISYITDTDSLHVLYI